MSMFKPPNPHQWSIEALTFTASDAVGAYVDIKITDGAKTLERKVEMLAQTIEMLRALVGAIQEACYVVIDDISTNT